MALTIQQVHNTADQLQEQGIKPTLAEVRKALGGGSFTTISEAMKSPKGISVVQCKVGVLGDGFSGGLNSVNTASAPSRTYSTISINCCSLSSSGSSSSAT